MRQLVQNRAANVMVFMTAAADHVTGAAGLTLGITASLDGGAFAGLPVPAVGVTDRGNGWYALALAAAHVPTLGDFALHITGTGGTTADPADVLIRVVAVDAQDAVRFGLSALPNAAAQAAGGLYTRGTGAGQINQPANGVIDTNVASMGADVLTGAAMHASASAEIDTTLSGTHGAGAWGGGGGAPTAAQIADAVWEEPLAPHTTGGSAGLVVSTNLNATVSSRAAPGAAMTLTGGERDAVADAHFARALPGSPALGTAGEALEAARAQGIGKWRIIGDNLNIYAPDDVTVLKSLPLSPAGGPWTGRG